MKPRFIVGYRDTGYVVVPHSSDLVTELEVRCDRITATPFASGSWLRQGGAGEVGSVVDAAGSAIMGELRIGTQGAGAINLAVGFVGGDEPCGREILGYPLIECGESVELIRT